MREGCGGLFLGPELIGCFLMVLSLGVLSRGVPLVGAATLTGRIE